MYPGSVPDYHTLGEGDTAKVAAQFGISYLGAIKRAGRGGLKGRSDELEWTLRVRSEVANLDSLLRIIFR
jgi:hypothetical protein